MRPKRFYVYILDDWLGVPRYVGAGSGVRWNTTRFHDDGNPAKNAFLKETRSRLGRIPFRIIKDDLSQEEAWQLELQIIDQIGRKPDGPLVNLSVGGGQGPIGVRRSEEQRAKISASLTGRTLSPDHVAAIAAASTGRTQSEEVKKRKNAKLRGRKRTPEQLARIRAAVARRASRKGIPLTADQRANQSAGAKARWTRDPAPRAQRGEDGKFTKETAQ